MRKDALKLAVMLYVRRAQELTELQAQKVLNEQAPQTIDFHPPTKAQLQLIEEAFVELEKETTKKVIHEALSILNPYIDEVGGKNNFKPNKEQKAAEKLLSEVSNKLRTLGGFIQPGEKEGV